MSKPRVVTTSWDDGSLSDLKIAELSRSRGIRGTFYVPITHEHHRVLGHAELRSLRREGFEVGAHGLSHETLPDLPVQEIDRQVRMSKEILEDILGEPVQLFCYPRGRYDARVRRCVKQAGYRAARTIQMLAVDLSFDAFEMPTSLQAYPHRRPAYIKNLAKRRQISDLFHYATRLSGLHSWLEIAKELFDSVLREGGMWHLYGHSWEIEKLGLWDDLREILDYVGGRNGVLYLSNVGVIDLVQQANVREEAPVPSTKVAV